MIPTGMKSRTWVRLLVISGWIAITAMAGAQGLMQVAAVPTGGAANHIAISGAFLVVQHNGASEVEIIDVSNPSQPIVMSAITFPFAGRAIDVAIEGDRVYTLSVRRDSFQHIAHFFGVRVFDISNVISPVQIGNQYFAFLPGFDGGGPQLRDFGLSGNLVFVLDDTGRTTVLDFSIPNSPVFRGQAPRSVGATGIAVTGPNSFYTFGTSLDEWLHFPPDRPKLRSFKAYPDVQVDDVAAVGNGFWVALGDGSSGFFGSENSHHGVRNLDDNVQPGAAYLRYPAHALGSQVIGGATFVAVANDRDGLLIYDESFTLRANAPAEHRISDVIFRNSTVFAADGDAGVRIFQFTP